MERRKRGSPGDFNGHLLSKHYRVSDITSVSNETPAPAFHLTRFFLKGLFQLVRADHQGEKNPKKSIKAKFELRPLTDRCLD